MYEFNIGDMVELDTQSHSFANAVENGLEVSKIYQIINLGAYNCYIVMDSKGKKFEVCFHDWFKPVFKSTLPVIDKYDEAVRRVKQMYKETYKDYDVSAIRDHERQVLRKVLAKAFNLYPREETNIVFSTSPGESATYCNETAADDFDFKKASY